MVLVGRSSEHYLGGGPSWAGAVEEDNGEAGGLGGSGVGEEAAGYRS